jgi:hypothetical protein
MEAHPTATDCRHRSHSAVRHDFQSPSTGRQPMIGDFPPHVQANVRRILDAEARRLLLAAQTNGDTVGTPPRGSDDRALDRGFDQRASSG